MKVLNKERPETVDEINAIYQTVRSGNRKKALISLAGILLGGGVMLLGVTKSLPPVSLVGMAAAVFSAASPYIIPGLRPDPLPKFAGSSAPWGLLQETADRYPEVHDDLNTIKATGRDLLVSEVHELLGYGYKRSKSEDAAEVLGKHSKAH